MPDPDRDRRVQPRERRRLGCEVRVDGKAYTGVILDLSAQGLFVRINLEPPEDTPVAVRIRRPGGECWEITARVARKAPRAPGAPSRRGLGLEIVEAPVSYHEFLRSLAR